MNKMLVYCVILYINLCILDEHNDDLMSALMIRSSGDDCMKMVSDPEIKLVPTYILE